MILRFKAIRKRPFSNEADLLVNVHDVVAYIKNAEKLHQDAAVAHAAEGRSLQAERCQFAADCFTILAGDIAEASMNAMVDMNQ